MKQYQQSDLPDYIKYWNEDFPQVLLWYYKEWSNHPSNIPSLILSAKHNSFDDIRPTILLLEPSGKDGIIDRKSPQTRISSDEFFFSASMYYLSLIPQVIAKTTSSPETARLFFRASGWPAISLGLGGFMSAEHILYESDLLPYPNEVQRYISLLVIIHDYHKKEVVDFISGNAQSNDMNSYRLFCESANGFMEQICTELDRCQQSFIKNCEDIKVSNAHTWNPMYLEDNGYFFK